MNIWVKSVPRTEKSEGFVMGTCLTSGDGDCGTSPVNKGKRST